MRLIVDGNNTAYRSNSVMNLTTKSGENVSAIYGTLSQIKSWLDAFRDVKEVIVCWDCGRSARRMAIYPEYKDKSKMKDKQTDEEREAFAQFIGQMEQVHEFLPNLGVKSVKIKGWEADDLVYGLSHLGIDDDCVLVSTDQDYYQLISDRVSVYNPTRENLYTLGGVYKNVAYEKNVRREMVKPVYFNDGAVILGTFSDVVGYPLTAALSYKMLVGDSSDNITGVPQVGEETAKALCATYGSLTGILAARSLIMMSKGGQSFRHKKIFENIPLIQRNNLLINLSFVDLSTIESQLREVLSAPTEVNDKEVKRFLMAKEFVSFLSQYLPWISPFHSLSNS